MSTVSVDVNLAIETCYRCGLVFGLPDYMQARCRRDGATFYCPNGHGQVYAEPEVDRLKQEIKKAKQEAARLRGYLDQTEAQLADEQGSRRLAERRAAAARGQVTKIKKRVANGVCPCCQRTFADLARHMKGQHPDWEQQEEATP